MTRPGTRRLVIGVVWFAAVAGLSLFAGLVLGTAGAALHPPLFRVAAPLVCDGEMQIESRRYSYRPGQSGVDHRVYCAAAGGEARRDVTGRTVVAASALYAGLAFAGLLAASVIAAAAIRVLRGRPGAEPSP